MSSANIALLLQNGAARARSARRVVRIALYAGELLRVPRGLRRLHVISGTAWVSTEGRDVVASSGQCVSLPGCRSCALVSGLRGEPLLFELW